MHERKVRSGRTIRDRPFPFPLLLRRPTLFAISRRLVVSTTRIESLPFLGEKLFSVYVSLLRASKASRRP